MIQMWNAGRYLKGDMKRTDVTKVSAWIFAPQLKDAAGL